MAKICGVINSKYNKKKITSLVCSLTSSMKHSSWNKESSVSFFGIGLGQVNLNQINIRQPFWNKDKSLVIIMAGKVFGNDEKNDLKFILNGYEKCNKNGHKFSTFVRKLNGVFTFAIYDKKEKKLVLANDRYGYRPLFYYQNKNQLLFASEVKAILQDASVQKCIDWKAWADFIYMGTIYGNNTFFKDIKALSPASILTFQRGELQIEEYWCPRDVKIDYQHNSPYFIAKAKKLILQSIKRQTKDLKSADCFLTGGFDSRCIAMAIKHQRPKLKLKTYTTLKEGDNNQDKILAKKVGDFLGFSNVFVPLPEDLYQKYLLDTFYLTDGLLNEHLFLLPLIDQLDNRNINFDGIIGDILLKGSFTNEHTLTPKKFFNLVFPKERDKLVDKIFIPQIAKKIKGLIRKSLTDEIKKLKDFPNYITLFYLFNEGRRKVALSSMCTTLTKKESFMPFLDNDLVEFALSIPVKTKVQSNLYVKVMQSINKDCMDIPSTHGTVNQKNYSQKLKRLSFIRNLRQKIYFFILSSPMLMNIIPRFLSYKRYSLENLNFEKKIIKNTFVKNHFVKAFSHSFDLASKLRFHFLLWEKMFLKSNTHIEKYTLKTINVKKDPKRNNN
jgi:asparagine synthase (glutamine-hydrolysing)